jgi:hypothetical protein
LASLVQRAALVFARLAAAAAGRIALALTRVGAPHGW